jgi:cobalt-zinc-cadmium efflux system protein
LHAHAHGTGQVLRWSLAATVLFVVIEAVAGIQAGSLALLSDAGHNVTDALALLLAWLGAFLESKPADEVKTYGYQRAGVLSALINALTLMALSAWIFYESYHRLRHPEPVQDRIMLVVAGFGLLVNGGIMWGLRTARHRDINIRSAYMHMLGDALGSIAIMGGAVAIHYTGWDRVDPLLSILIGLLIIWTAWDIIRESLNILLEGLPRGMRLQSVIASMRATEGVLDVHDLHIWSLGSDTHALSCHVVIADVPPSSSDSILKRLNEMLAEHYRIRHTTIQFEHVECALSGSGCAISVGVGKHDQPHHHHH